MGPMQTSSPSGPRGGGSRKNPYPPMSFTKNKAAKMAIIWKVSSERNEITGSTRESPRGPKSESRTKPQRLKGRWRF
jgi:hypothetical protein